jgi:putative transposase
MRVGSSGFLVPRCGLPKGLKRYYGRGDLHFLTFSCYQRRELLAAKRAKNLLVRELARVRGEYAFLLVGYVVMPNHVHLLMSEPGKGSVSTVLQMLKQRVARKMRTRRRKAPHGQMRFPFERDEKQLRAFWQARFHDFNVYSRGKLR